MKSPEITILIPFLNESENIERLVLKLSDFFTNDFKISTEVIFIDDGSQDNSVALLKAQNHQGYEAKIIKLSKNYGSHAALRAGTRIASGNWITTVYADLQDPLSVIKELYQSCQNGYQITWGGRKSTQAGIFEKLFSNFYAFLMRKFAFPNYPKKNFDILMFGKKVAEELNKNIEANSSFFLQVFSMGFSQTFVSYKKEERQAGKSKWTLSKKFKLLIDSFVAFSYFPIRMVSVMGIVFFTLGTLWTMYIVSRELLVGDLETGWPALISILMIGFGVTNIGLGIVAEYLWRTLDASRHRPVFIIEEVIPINSLVNEEQKMI